MSNDQSYLSEVLQVTGKSFPGQIYVVPEGSNYEVFASADMPNIHVAERHVANREPLMVQMLIAHELDHLERNDGASALGHSVVLNLLKDSDFRASAEQHIRIFNHEIEFRADAAAARAGMDLSNNDFGQAFGQGALFMVGPETQTHPDMLARLGNLGESLAKSF